MAKGGVHSVLCALAIELAQDNIRVNALAPAVVEPPLFDTLLTSEQLASFNAFHPIGAMDSRRTSPRQFFSSRTTRCPGGLRVSFCPFDGGVTAGRNN